MAAMALTLASAVAAASPARRRLPHVRWLLGLVAVAPVLLLRAEVLTESDTFWETRAGLQILQDHALPVVDTYSWTAAGRPWILNSWGFDVLLGAADGLAGLVGVALIGLITGALLLALDLLLAHRGGASAALSGGLALLVTPLLIPWLAARPQLVDYAAVLVLVLLLERILRRPGVLPVVAGAALLVLWTNLHPGGLLGIAVEATLTAVVAVVPGLRRRLPWLLALVLASGAATLLNPYGWHVLLQATAVQQASTGLVAEWAPLDPADLLQDLSMAAGLLGLALAARARRWALASALVVTVVAGAMAVRILPIVVLLAVPAIAAAATPLLGRWVAGRRLVLAPAAALVVVLLVVPAVQQLGRFGKPSSALYPERLVAEIPAGCRLLEPYVIGGYVTLVRPDVRVSVDSRNDLYGAGLVRANERTVDGRDPDASLLARAGCALLPATSPTVDRLEASSAWRTLDRTSSTVLLVREG